LHNVEKGRPVQDGPSQVLGEAPGLAACGPRHYERGLAFPFAD